MRLCGAAAVMAGCLSLSLSALARLRAERLCLTGLIAALEALSTGLAESLRPTPELLAEAAARAEGEAGRFFAFLAGELGRFEAQSLAALWHKGVRTLLPSLREAEREALLPVGDILGRCDAQGQLGALRQSLASLRTRRDALRAGAADRRRLYLALGCAAGSFLCLMML